jgi:Putative restriction endonuclease
VFEMTSPSTRAQDEGFKKDLYEQMGVQEYWQFDPKGEWIAEQLRGYQLVGDLYSPIADNISLALSLRLEATDTLISFYRLDSGAKLLLPSELQAGWAKETQARIAAEASRDREAADRAAAEAKLAEYEARFGKLE